MLATSSLISLVAAIVARVVVSGAGVVVVVVVVVVLVVVVGVGLRLFLTTIRLRSDDWVLSAGLAVVLVVVMMLLTGRSVRAGALVVVELLMRQETFSG